jgi:hypothetical protein
MYDIGDVKGNHFCLLVFAQGKWKKKYGDKLAEKMQTDWLKLESELGTAEKSGLFDPKKLGKKIKDCKICEAIYEHFKNQIKGADNLILFSHYVPEEAGLKMLFNALMGDPQVQKVYYLEQNSAFYMMPPDQFIAKINSNIRKRATIDEFIRLIEYGRFETGVLYEIFPSGTKL